MNDLPKTKNSAAAVPPNSGRSLPDWGALYRKYFWLLAGAWTLAIGASLAWNVVDDTRQVKSLAAETARALFQKDLLYRRWATMHGGVYVPVTKETPPNPYLKVPERNIVTPLGKALTLMNPAYMTRQVFELQDQQTGMSGHITSLKPIRPENAPDPWERQALESFEKGQPEVSSVEPVRGQMQLRLMRPLPVEQGCLRCHEEQGYKVGEVRGGLSVSVPMSRFTVYASPRQLTLAHGGLWVLGLAGLMGGGRQWQRQMRERKQVEDQLHQLSRAVEQSPASIVITNPRGDIEYVNPKFCEVTGYAFDEARGKNPRILKSGETPPEGYRQLWETITAGREWRGEFHNKKKNGELYWEAASISPVVDETGRITHFLAVKEDITERKRAEKVLAESEAKFRVQFESSRDATMILDRDGFFDCNQATLEMFGCASRSEFVARHLAEFSPPKQADGTDSLAAVQARIEAAYATGTQFFPWLYRRVDGAVFPAEVLLSRFNLGGRPVLQAVVRDITERKKAEADRERLINELQKSLSEVKTLRGFIPICANCKKIRDDKGYWSQVETYVAKHSEATFSHGICPECTRKLYPDYVDELPSAGPKA